jgi:hypothetical protein
VDGYGSSQHIWRVCDGFISECGVLKNCHPHAQSHILLQIRVKGVSSTVAIEHHGAD